MKTGACFSVAGLFYKSGTFMAAPAARSHKALHNMDAPLATTACRLVPEFLPALVLDSFLGPGLIPLGLDYYRPETKVQNA